MTQAVEELEIGDTIELKGPLGSFTHLGKGAIRWRGKERKIKQVGLVCGGTGITPIMQVLQGVFTDEEDSSTEVFVVNGNRNEHGLSLLIFGVDRCLPYLVTDILMREELDQLLATHGESKRLRIHNTLSAPHDGWQFGRGRVNKDVLAQHLPPAHEDNVVCLCAPDGMQDVVKEALTSLGWNIESQLVIF